MSGTPAVAANPTTHEATGADVNVDATQAQSNQPNTHMNQIATLNEISELNEKNAKESDEEEDVQENPH